MRRWQSCPGFKQARDATRGWQSRQDSARSRLLGRSGLGPARIDVGVASARNAARTIPGRASWHRHAIAKVPRWAESSSAACQFHGGVPIAASAPFDGLKIIARQHSNVRWAYSFATSGSLIHCDCRSAHMAWPVKIRQSDQQATQQANVEAVPQLPAAERAASETTAPSRRRARRSRP